MDHKNNNSGNNKKKIKEAIVKTIAFFDLFDHPLTAFEIWKYLGFDCDYVDVLDALREPAIRRAIGEKHGLYYVRKRGRLLLTRHRRRDLSFTKHVIAIKAVKVLRFVCGIKMIAVCNNFSYHPESDIDLFIVVKKERMWSSRFLATLTMQFFGLRRHGTKVANRICLSFYVTEDNMDLSAVAYPDDPYFYNWLAWLTPVYDPEGIYDIFWEKNSWLKSHMPNVFKVGTGDELTVADNFFSRSLKRINSFWFDAAVGAKLDKTVKKIQLAKMAKNVSSVAAAHDSRVVISDRMLKFHEQDRRLDYRHRTNERAKEIFKVLEGGGAESLSEISAGENNTGGGRDRSRLGKLIEGGLYLLLFLLPWQTRWIISQGYLNGGFYEYATISLYASDILLILLFLLLGYNIFIKKSRMARQGSLMKDKRYWTFLFLLSGFDLFVFISALLSGNTPLSLFYYARFLLGISIFLLITNIPHNMLKLYYVIFASVFVQSLLAIWQFLTQNTFASKWLGMAWHGAGEGMAGVVEVAGGGRWLRAYGGLDHPNMLGGFLTVGLLLYLWISVARRYRPKRRFAFIFLHFVYLPVVFTALYFSFSRAAWLGLAVGVVVFLTLAVARRDLLVQKQVLRAVLVSGLVGFVLFSAYGDLTATRLSGATRLEKKSISERALSFYTSTEIIRGEPLWGVGVGNYTGFVHDHISPDQPAYSYQPVHNVYLLIASETGFFGNLFFVSLFVYLLMCLFRKCLQARDSCYILGLVLALLVMMMFDHWWWSLHFGVFFFWAFLGIIYKEIEAEG